MLENLRRKSLTKTYNDPTHQVALELGCAHYESWLSIEQYKQRISKENVIESFPNTFNQVSKGFKSISHSLGNVDFNMIACQSGAFTMGHNGQDDNKPRTEMIERPFLLGETELTQELYQAVVGTNPSHFQKNSQNPVEAVSWEDAIFFCNELSKLQGLEQCYTENSNSKNFGWDCNFDKNGYRLPTEKEWEYAAKAGTDNRWAGTDNKDKLGEYAWFYDNSAAVTHPIKMKKPNEWGFYDMSGNVYEWCWDKYNPKGDSSAYRVLRGGGWGYIASNLCSAARLGRSPSDRRKGIIGFRVCRSIVN